MPASPEDTNERKDQELQDLSKGEIDNDVVSSPVKRQRMTNEALEWEQIEIDIGWGTLRGKARGSGPRLILGLHGWLDNANTFDLIAPLLPKNVRFLSLDLPGHGLSDHFPPGFIYDPRGYVGAVKKAMIAIDWKKFILLGHSMGAAIGILYTSIFQEDVEAFISIDIIKPWSSAPDEYASQLKKYFFQYFDNENKAALPALIYQYEELVKKTIEGSKSLDDRGARILLQRGARRTENGEGFILTRDLRAKAYFVGFISLEAWLELAKSITCPLLFIKAKEGHYYETSDLYETMLKAFKQDCKHCCYHEISGKHHIHLTHADTVGVFIKTFLEECKIEHQNCTTNNEV